MLLYKRIGHYNSVREKASGNVAVAVGIFVQIFLVIFLGGEKVFQRLDCHRKGRARLLLLTVKFTANSGELGFVGVINAGAVLYAGVMPLTVDAYLV